MGQKFCKGSGMNSVPELIDAFGGPAAFARILDLKGPSTASEMKRSQRIPVDYWPRVIDAARERGIRGVTPERLMAINLREAS